MCDNVDINVSEGRISSEFRDSCDIKVLPKEVEKVEEKMKHSALEDTDIESLLALYRGHFLPFIENLWVESYRDMLKSIVFSLFSKLYLSKTLSSASKLKMLRIFPELQMSVIDLSTLESLSGYVRVNIGDYVFGVNEELGILRITNIPTDMLLNLIKGCSEVSFVGDNEVVLVVNSETIHALIKMKKE